MGRSALYRSTAEQKIHSRARRARYNQTDRYLQRLLPLWMLTHRQSARAKALKRQYNYDYYRRKNGRKEIRQVVQSIPEASDVLPERLLANANALTTQLPDAAASEPVNTYVDAYGAYIDALKSYYAIEGVLDHNNDTGTQTIVLQQRAREVLRAYENMARLTQPGDW